MLKKSLGIACAVLAVSASLPPANAQSQQNFYEGKTIDLVISSSAGGGNDAYGRLIARYLSKYIPGHPTIVPQNMPGAGGMSAANYLYNVAKRDGTFFGEVQNIVPFQPLLGEASAKYDALNFNYIGSVSSDISIMFVWNSSQIKSFEDVLAKPSAMSGSNGSLTSLYANAIDQILGGKIKHIGGYPGSTEAYLAVERGEVDGYPAASWASLKMNKQDWIRQGEIRLVVQLAPKRIADLPNVPAITEFLKTDAQRQAFELIMTPQELGGPFIAPPQTDAGRIELLQKAFVEATRDPELLSDAKKENLDIKVVTGPMLQTLVQRAYRTPQPVIEMVRRANKG